MSRTAKMTAMTAQRRLAAMIPAIALLLAIAWPAGPLARPAAAQGKPESEIKFAMYVTLTPA